MTFSEYESSIEAGSPIELYEFDLDGLLVRYTNAEQDFVFQSQTYFSEPGISRGKIVTTLINTENKLQIQVSGSNLFARLYIGSIPGELPEVVIRQIHVDDPDAEAIFVFEGVVSSVGFTDDLSIAEFICRPITSATRRVLPRHSFQSLCNNYLYDTNCTISEITFQENVTVESVSGRVLTIDSGQLTTEAAGYWLGGFIEINKEFRSIVLQPVGRVMTLDLPFRNDPTGTTVRILPGCDHLIDGDCENTYSNAINHGGWVHVPGEDRNPFNGLD